MKIVTSIFVATVLSSGTGVAFAASSSFGELEVGGWVVQALRDDATKAFSYCAAFRQQTNTKFVFAIAGEGFSAIAFQDESWGAPAGSDFRS